MESEFVPLDSGLGQRRWHGASVTIADTIMEDGKSLDKVGVTPDELLLPTQTDLAQNRDPILSYAAKLAGVDLTPEKAGALFRYEWPKE